MGSFLETLIDPVQFPDFASHAADFVLQSIAFPYRKETKLDYQPLSGK